MTTEPEPIEAYVPRTDEELYELATEILDEKVFGTWNIPKEDLRLLPSIFMPTILVDDEIRRGWRRDKVVHFYEHLAEAAPRGINGYPCFLFSMHELTQGELDRMKPMMEKLKSMMEKLKQEREALKQRITGGKHVS